VNVKDPNSGVNAFWLACLYGHGQIMRKLANSNADIYVTNSENINVLHLAVYKDKPQIVKMLLQSNFSLTLQTKKGYTVIHLAVILNRYAIMEIILDYLKEGQFKKRFVTSLINLINQSTHMSALSMAIFNINLDIAVCLISFGAQSYFGNSDETKDLSPIFLAVEIEDANLIETMCDHHPNHGSSLNVLNSNLQTPLMYASLRQK
jgi:ankyrin repeat protein